MDNRIIRTPQLPVSLLIGGQAAEVLFAGTALGPVDGVTQVEAIIPASLAGAGPVPVVLAVGTTNSQTNVRLL